MHIHIHIIFYICYVIYINIFIIVGDINFDDISLEKSYGTWKAYEQSKLANILFTKELARRLKGQ